MPSELKGVVQAVSAYLFAERHAKVYAILDGASIEELRDFLYRYEPEHECLYRGDLEDDIAEVAPYLVKLEPESAFTDWVLAQGWGNHWGVFAVSREELAPMRRHFRKFLTVHNSAGEPMLFRYYDPRVLRVYLPTCNASELETVFGPVMAYLQEGEDAGELLRFQVAGGSLLQQSKSLMKKE